VTSWKNLPKKSHAKNIFFRNLFVEALIPRNPEPTPESDRCHAPLFSSRSVQTSRARGRPAAVAAANIAGARHVAEPSELFRFKCINHHLQRPDDLKCTSNGTTHGSVGSTPDATTVTQDRSRLYSYKVKSRYITTQAFIT
jgi:hypothetical protein